VFSSSETTVIQERFTEDGEVDVTRRAAKHRDVFVVQNGSAERRVVLIEGNPANVPFKVRVNGVVEEWAAVTLTEYRANDPDGAATSTRGTASAAIADGN
jgi:hypothetical protein